jgi:hypothetical protein
MRVMNPSAQRKKWIQVSLSLFLKLQRLAIATSCPVSGTSADLTCPNSRHAIKKYIRANNNLGDITDAMFSSHVNRAIANGEKNGEFVRPKGKLLSLHEPYPPCRWR